MNKTISYIAVMATAIFAASCQKESLRENTATEGSASVFTATIETVSSTKTTVERVEVGDAPVTYKTYWEETDRISINGVSYTATPDGTDATKATFTIDSGNDPTGTFKAYFPATMFSDSKATLPATYTYVDADIYPKHKYNMPMYAESESFNLAFKNLCGVLAINVSGSQFTSISSVEVLSDKQMNGEFTATSDGVLTFKSMASLTDDLKKVNISINPAKELPGNGSATFYIPVPAGTHNLTIKVSDGTTITKTMITKKSGGVTVERNTVYPIGFEDNSDALPGVFTVSDPDGTPNSGDEKKVRFSHGNLWYGPKTTGASPTFNFEEYQYEISSSWTTSHVSNFFWSKTASSAYSTGYDNVGTTTDVLFTNATETTPKADFTVNGLKGVWNGVWRTLSRTEWQYLLNNHEYKYVKVGDRYGIVIAPDGFSGTIEDSYDTYDWFDADDAGLVFLPSTGFRQGTYISENKNTSTPISCIYWTSTAVPDKQENAYRMFFQWNGSKLSTNFDTDGLRYWAVGIRLVSDVK